MDQPAGFQAPRFDPNPSSQPDRAGGSGDSVRQSGPSGRREVEPAVHQHEVEGFDRPVRFLPAGDRALVVEFGNEISPAIHARVRALTQALQVRPIPGVMEVVPTYRSVLVYFDPMQVAPAALEQGLLDLVRNREALQLPAPTVTVIPVCYGGEFGPDLPFVCEHTGLSADEVIRIHTGRDYLIYMLGFTPGFPYLGGMDERIAAPRLESPRTKIPAGSVGIAGKQTGVYPVESPGGWRIIGQTPIKLYDPYRQPPVLLAPGNYVRFKAVTREEYEAIAAQVATGTYRVEVMPRVAEH
ncbi:TIGR00370 family protein [Thermaerobacter subterraneus DSM 13965]|uniref:TIGR00370 family protein n=1 Tax=Thermaerobacter subterraneus DSM 13965 TaxID=867903 RepID=K6PQF1_9FIRM|nr:TIGR00370 family protein [Thermaerobacter subterraneus DSM 13965]